MSIRRVIWIPIIVLIVSWDSISFFLFVLSLVLLALLEFYNVMEKKKYYPQKFLGLLGGIFLYSCIYLFEKGFDVNVIGSIVTVFLFLFFIVSLIKKDVRYMVSSVSVTFLGIFYIPWLIAHSVLLRDIRPYGKSCVYLLLFTIWSVKIADYWAGIKFGKHKINSLISPDKSYEGIVTGLLAGIAAVFIWKGVSGLKYFQEWGLTLQFLSGLRCIIIGLILGISGQAGDLVGSLVVRDSNGRILAHMNSFLFSAPLLYYYLKFFVL